jgi:hypothetical protein
MMEAASTSETSVNFHQTTRRNNPEDSHLHTCRRENFRSYLSNLLTGCIIHFPSHKHDIYNQSLAYTASTTYAFHKVATCCLHHQGQEPVSQGRTLADWFLSLKPIPRARLTHRLCKHLWNVGKLLLDYTAHRRQPSSHLPPWEPGISQNL